MALSSVVCSRLQPVRATRIYAYPRLYIYHQNQCDPKKCTGLKLARHGYAQLYHTFNRIPKGALILTPEARKTLSIEDLKTVERNGLGAIDCSWATADFLSRIEEKRGRSLPWLVAGNPVNYGISSKLTTLEAFSASLWLLGFREGAEQLLSLYKWGATFLTLNLHGLEKYAGSSSSMIEETQDALLKELLRG